MCANECPLGYQRDANGCMKCECMKAESELCDGHTCAGGHTCVIAKLPFCEILGNCAKAAMCIPDGHDQFHPDAYINSNPEDRPEPMKPEQMIPEVFNSICQFRQGLSKKLAEEAKNKYANHSMLGRILSDEAMNVPVCTEDGKFRPLQCHAAKQNCWCVNNRGFKVPDSVTKVKSKTDVPKCIEHITKMIEGSFVINHEFDDVEPHLTNIANLVHDHLAEWMNIDAAQIVIKQVSPIEGGKQVMVHFTLHRTDENELHSAELMLNWHLGKVHSTVPYADTFLTPDQKSLTMEHMVELLDQEDEVVLRVPEDDRRKHHHHGHHGDDDDKVHQFVEMYEDHKVAVICGGVGILVFIILFIAVIVTLCKRGTVTSNQFKHKRMSDKSKKYKENLAFANDMYGKQTKAEKVEAEAEPEPEPKE